MEEFFPTTGQLEINGPSAGPTKHVFQGQSNCFTHLNSSLAPHSINGGLFFEAFKYQSDKKPFHRLSGFIVAEMGNAVTFEVEHKRLDIKGLLGDVVDPSPGT